ncbi:helix-turn-helix domain-containing protein [Methylorubrum thiocyanatum]|uniref:helix-turn-helix domain-containing protein n=1 Tax=Methylorubrum thiocyanatum TaxID=47958 RepID=UPI00398C2C4A
MRMPLFAEPGPDDEGAAEMLASAMSLDDLAERLGVSPRKARDLVDKGEIAAIDVGSGAARRHLRIIEADFQGFLVRRRIKAPKARPFDPPAPPRPKPLSARPKFSEIRAAEKARAALKPSRPSQSRS